MLKNLTADNIFIVCGHTDMRKSIDGLAALVQQQFQLDLFTNSAFLFCGRRRDRMKVLLWEDDGFLLLYKRLEDGKFTWPRNEQEVRNITREQFIWLTQGLSIDQPKAIKKVVGGVDDYSALRKTSIRRKENNDPRQGKRQSARGTQ